MIVLFRQTKSVWRKDGAPTKKAICLEEMDVVHIGKEATLFLHLGFSPITQNQQETNEISQWF